MTVERFLLGLRSMEEQSIEIAKTATTVTMFDIHSLYTVTHVYGERTRGGWSQ